MQLYKTSSYQCGPIKPGLIFRTVQKASQKKSMCSNYILIANRDQYLAQTESRSIVSQALLDIKSETIHKLNIT